MGPGGVVVVRHGLWASPESAPPGDGEARGAALPFDIARRVEEAKSKAGSADEARSKERLEEIRGKRERKKELLRSFRRQRLKSRLAAFGFEEVDEELSQLQGSRRRQDSFETVDRDEKASWLGPLAKRVAPPRRTPSDDDDAPASVGEATTRRDHQQAAPGLRFPSEAAAPVERRPPPPLPDSRGPGRRKGTSLSLQLCFGADRTRSQENSVLPSTTRREMIPHPKI